MSNKRTAGRARPIRSFNAARHKLLSILKKEESLPLVSTKCYDFLDLIQTKCSLRQREGSKCEKKLTFSMRCDQVSTFFSELLSKNLNFYAYARTNSLHCVTKKIFCLFPGANQDFLITYDQKGWKIAFFLFKLCLCGFGSDFSKFKFLAKIVWYSVCVVAYLSLYQ